MVKISGLLNESDTKDANLEKYLSKTGENTVKI